MANISRYHFVCDSANQLKLLTWIFNYSWLLRQTLTQCSPNVSRKRSQFMADLFQKVKSRCIGEFNYILYYITLKILWIYNARFLGSVVNVLVLFHKTDIFVVLENVKDWAKSSLLLNSLIKSRLHLTHLEISCVLYIGQYNIWDIWDLGLVNTILN